MTGYTGSVLVYMQLMLIMCVFYSFYSDFGWYEISSAQSNARFYINPLQSCIFDSNWSERYQGNYILTFCESTEDFVHHLTNSTDEVLIDFIHKEDLFARFSMWFGLATLVMFLMYYCVQHWSARSQIVFSTILAISIMIQFISLMEVFALMSNIASRLEMVHQLASFHFFHRVNDVSMSKQIGFYLGIFASCLQVVCLCFLVYKIIMLLVLIRDNNSNNTSGQKQSKNMPRYIYACNRKGYEKISGDDRFNVSGASEH